MAKVGNVEPMKKKKGSTTQCIYFVLLSSFSLLHVFYREAIATSRACARTHTLTGKSALTRRGTRMRATRAQSPVHARVLSYILVLADIATTAQHKRYDGCSTSFSRLVTASRGQGAFVEGGAALAPGN